VAGSKQQSGWSKIQFTTISGLPILGPIRYFAPDSLDRRAHEKSRTCCLCRPFSPRAVRRYFARRFPDHERFRRRLLSQSWICPGATRPRGRKSRLEHLQWSLLGLSKHPRWLGIVTLVHSVPAPFYGVDRKWNGTPVVNGVPVPDLGTTSLTFWSRPAVGDFFFQNNALPVSSSAFSCEL
jgi:hypothetical protein